MTLLSYTAISDYIMTLLSYTAVGLYNDIIIIIM